MEDNLHMKFSAMNVNFSNLSLDPLSSRRPAQCACGCQRGAPFLKVIIYPLLACLTWKWLQIGTDILLNITSISDELLRIVNIDDFDWTWTLKIGGFGDLFAIFGCKGVNCDEMNGGRPRLPVNMNCYRLLRVSWALAQISCFRFSIMWFVSFFI